MTCGGSSCNFCGCEVLTNTANVMLDSKKIGVPCHHTLLYSWLSTGEILTKQGKLIKATNNEISERLADKDYNYYTNRPDFYPETSVFLHTFCRVFIMKHTGWNLKTIYEILLDSKEPYVVHDNQDNMMTAMRREGIPIWRAVSPKISKDNQEFFQQRLQTVRLRLKTLKDAKD
jgi:hypothetical protein